MDNPSELEYFSLNITLLRSKRGWSQKEFATRIGTGIGPSTVSNWEKGVAFPQLADFVRVYKLFGVTPSELFKPVERSLVLMEKALRAKNAMEAREAEREKEGLQSSSREEDRLRITRLEKELASIKKHLPKATVKKI